LSPSPCEGWAAVDVAGHVTAGLLVVEMRAAGRGHQLDFVMPGSSPRWAISRKQTRHRPNFR
ncbi:hypothetical protein, partial [Actinomadura luteofluorescens]